MSVEVKLVESKRELKSFINFPRELYKGNPYYVPALFFDEVNTLDSSRNPASEFCDSALWLAWRDGKVVGRVAAIVNRLANSQWNHQEVRFGWYDFIDDREVSAALMAKVEEFGRQHGMDSVVGPLGFTDFDPEGMLIAGYDKLSTMALIYNYPYYKEHIESMGFEKDAEWMELKVTVDKLPERMLRLARIVSERAEVHILPLTRKMVHKQGYGQKVFNLINECYKDLYNFTVLPEHMAEKYLSFYLSVLDLKYVTLLENDKGELVAFGIVMPSLAKALQKCGGKLLPFGWIPVLKAMYGKNEGCEMLLIGVRPDYQNTGINSLLFTNAFRIVSESGAKWAETNAILETNLKNQGQFRDFNAEQAKRRRTYKKAL